MMSLALRHKAKRLEMAKAISEGKTKDQAEALVMNVGAKTSDHDRATLLAALDNDLGRLGERESIAEKATLKADELLPKYLPHVYAYLKSGARYPNAVLVRAAIWAIDVGDLETALELADACISQQQPAPSNFNRDLPTFFVEEIADWAERQTKAEKSASPYIDEVCNRLTTGAWQSLNVIARGKAFKAGGVNAQANGDERDALNFYIQAQIENEAAGCKTRIKTLALKLGVEVS